MSEPLRCVVCDTAHDDWDFRGETAVGGDEHNVGMAKLWECARCGDITEVL